jgi:GTPase
MCGNFPDYATIVVAANEKIDFHTGSGLEPFKLAFGFNIPVFVVITKVDCVRQVELNAQIQVVRLINWINRIKGEENSRNAFL